MNRQILSPSEAADFIDSLSPVEVKNRLLDLLLWQAAHGRVLVHFSWYLRKMKDAKPKTQQEWQQLTQKIGRTG